MGVVVGCLSYVFCIYCPAKFSIRFDAANIIYATFSFLLYVIKSSGLLRHKLTFMLATGRLQVFSLADTFDTVLTG